MTFALQLLVVHLPYFALLLAAAGVAMVRYDRHPVASVLVCIGAGVGVVGHAVSALLPTLYASGGRSQLGLVSAAIGLLNFASLGALLLAAFVERPAAPHR